MKKIVAIAAAACALGISGCATTETQDAAGAKAADNVEYSTGSRLPRKVSADQPVKSVSGDEWRRAASSAIGNAPRGN